MHSQNRYFQKGAKLECERKRLVQQSGWQKPFYKTGMVTPMAHAPRSGQRSFFAPQALFY
jgi:hypothetical protein